MAQTGYTPILTYASGTASNVPLAANLTTGASGAELAINYTDGKLFYKDNAGVVQTIASKASTTGTVSTVGFTGGIVSVANPTTTPALTVAGTSGGVPYFTSASTWASSGAFTANALMLGGGAGSPPTALGSLGTTSTVLHGNAAGAPTFGAVALATEVSGTLLNTNGGTGQSSAFTQYGVTYASTTTALATTSAGTSSTVLHGNAAGAPTFGAVALGADVSGTLPLGNGGTGLTSFTAGDLVYFASGTSFTKLGIGTAGQYLTVNSGATAPQWTTAVASGVSSITFGSTGLTPSTATTGAVTVAGTLSPVNGGTGISNNASATVTSVGNFSYTRTLSGATNVTFPTTGTLATLAGTETFTAKTLTNPTVTNYTETLQAIGTVGASSTLALTNGTVLTATLTASTPCTFTMPTATAGKSFILILTQAASGMTTATFTGVKWPAGTAPTITATASAVDILSFVSNGSFWYGSAAQAFA